MTDFTVTRRSVEQIEQIAAGILSGCPKLENGAIDILSALREPSIKTVHGKKTLRLILVEDNLLPGKLAQMWASKDRVTVTSRTSLWNLANECDATALKELRHEYSHCILHSGERTAGNVPLDRRLSGNRVHEFIDPEERSEDQADWLGACLAMPRDKIRSNSDVRDIAADWNVTLKDAGWRLEIIRLSSPRKVPDSITRRLDTIGEARNVPVGAQILWDSLPHAPQCDPGVARLADGFLVEYSQFRQYTQTGWAAEKDRIVPLMSRMNG